MQTSVKDGMITMTKSLESLVQAGKIDANAAKILIDNWFNQNVDSF